MALTKVSTAVVDLSGSTGALEIAKGTTAERDAITSPTIGLLRFNTTDNTMEVYTDNSGTPGWQALAEGGNVLTPLTVDYLVVAGGGAGGIDGGRGGGGGAGGLLTSISQTPLTLSTSTQYTVTVGQGGLGSTSVINNGDDSEINGSDITTITATGGGRGGGGPQTGGNNRNGSNGGSGGGAIAYYAGGNPGIGNTPATTPSQGNNGGDALSSFQYGAGGGGGAGAAGANGSGNNGGIGGIGVTNSITVASGAGPYYAGGGAGGGTGGNVSGGTGGGGSYNNSTGTGSDGTNGLGGGGAGGGMAGAPASGGDGVVILRYATADIAGYTVTGAAPTEDTTVAGQTILSFTTVGTGTITFTAPTPPTPTFDGTKVTNPVTDFDKTNTTQGLKIPIGTNSNIPTGVQGMLRNDTDEDSGGAGSTTAITHYNGTEWRYFASTESPVIDPNLVLDLNASDTASYPGSGTTWSDLTDNNNDGAISGATWNNSGYFDFDGSNDDVRLNSGNTIPAATFDNCTFEYWIRLDNLSETRHLYFHDFTSNNANLIGISKSNTNNKLMVFGSISHITISRGNTDLVTNQWTHIAVLLTSSQIKMYINGGLDATVSQSFNGFSSPLYGTIGNDRQGPSAAGIKWLNGQISKVRIYDKVLTQTEITALYNEGP